MPRTPKIRWTKAQQERLMRAVRSFNAALGWARRRSPQNAEFMPETASYKALRQTITSARQLNNVVRRLMRGGKASAFELVQNAVGTITTKWQRREAQIVWNVEERRRSMARRSIEQSTGTAKGHMRTVTEYNLAPQRIRVDEMTAAQMKRAVEVSFERGSVNRYDRAVNLYYNYVDAMRAEGFDHKFPKAHAEITSIITEMADKDPSFLLSAYESHTDELSIEFVYDDLQYLSVRASAMIDAWREVYSEFQEKTGAVGR